MPAEIANRQLLSIAHEVAAEGGEWADFLLSANIPFVNVDDSFARLDWDHYVRVMDAAVARWGLERLQDIAFRSVFAEEVASFRDGITVQCDNLDEMMTHLFSNNGAFASVLPCVAYGFEKAGRKHWVVEMTMNPGYELSPAHCHFGVGVMRALPCLLFENEALIELEIQGSSARYHFRVPGWHPLAKLRLRYARSKSNLGLAQRVGDTFNELMVRQARLQAEAERRAEVEAELAHFEKLEALGRLTGSVAHDFNNLLTVIQGQLELLGMDLQDEQLIDRLNVAVHAADRGARLTSQLLAFGRRAALQPESTDVNAVIEGMMPMFASTFDTLIVNVETDLAHDISATFVDRSKLETALLNLAINARDAMPAGGTLAITTTNVEIDDASQADVTPGHYVLVKVSDTGQGIPADVLERVFEPFFSTKEPGGGTGLGLSMVWGFLKQSGGNARISSTIGKGTTVWLYFPAFADPRQAEPEPPETTRNPDTVSKDTRILIVEDEEDVRIVVADMLKQLGYEVATAKNADEALETLRATHFALLLTDVVLPGGMSGPEIAQAARKLQPGLEVIFMSGYPDAEAVSKVSIRPSDTMLSKPFSYNRLSMTLQNVLEKDGVDRA